MTFTVYVDTCFGLDDYRGYAWSYLTNEYLNTIMSQIMIKCEQQPCCRRETAQSRVNFDRPM